MRFGKRRIGRGVKKERGSMNGIERQYAARLEAMRKSGEVLWWKYEACNFELAKKTFFRPDFLVMNVDLELEIHEVKAMWKGATGPHIEDDANVKIKVFAEMYPFRVVLAWIDSGFWKTKEV